VLRRDRAELGAGHLQLETAAERTNDGYVINGRKIWTTSAQRANKILIIARRRPRISARSQRSG
jgi:acyl-CoA dehydrogenase